jgi:hypothetical protein
MLPELTEFVPATRMGIVRKVLLGLENRAGCVHFFSMLFNGAYASFLYLSSRDSIGVHAKKIYYFVKLLLLDIALFE